jgi:hypothetical protein
MADNFIYIPLMNPVKFYDPARVVTDAFQTPQFDDFPFEERLLPWEQAKNFSQPWQVTDIIKLQFESTFDPIIVELVDIHGTAVITLPALIGLPHKYLANTWAYEIAMSLGTVSETGCYRLKATCGSGDGQKIFYTKWMYVSVEAIQGTILTEYWNTRFHDDVMFESGIKFQVRLYGHVGKMLPKRTMEVYRDQRNNPYKLSDRTYRQFELVYGDEYGVPDEIIDLISRIWSCNNVYVDNKQFAAIEGDIMDLVEVEQYARRGVKMVVDEGISRGSKIFSIETDTTKKLVYAINVEAKVWGDTSNQGSSNTVPIITVE